MSSAFKFQTEYSFVPNKKLLNGYTINLIILSQSLLQFDHFLSGFFKSTSLPSIVFLNLMSSLALFLR